MSALPPGLVYDVYVDGQFVKKGPFVRREFPAGRHFVTISATNGRRHRFEVILKPDQELKRVWDFNRNEWRR